MRLTTLATAATLSSLASAHTIFVQLNGNPVGFGIRDPSYDGPIYDVTSNDIVCNGGTNPTTPSSDVITVQAGSSAELTWRHTLTSGSDDVIDASHKGPVMAYMKKVTDATKDTGVGNGWFKIAADGFDGSKWGVDRLIANGGVQTVTIPKCIAPGQYLLRGEVIALHGAENANGAQFYVNECASAVFDGKLTTLQMECAQINVTGGEASKTPATVSFPGAYKATDPGILVNIYSGLTSYTVPGPSVFTC